MLIGTVLELALSQYLRAVLSAGGFELLQSRRDVLIFLSK